MSEVLTSLCSRLGISRRRRLHVAEVKLPAEFSFIDAPESTLESIVELAKAFGTGAREVHIDHSACEHGDHCAESVAAVIAMQGRSEGRARIRGTLPTKPSERDRVIASGLPKRLGIKVPEIADYFEFSLRKGEKRRERANRSTQREIVATHLTEYIDECLARYRWRLADTAQEFISSILGEVIGNAEDHSQTRDWWASAYLHEEKKGQYGDCHITIFNFGQTIFQSLQSLPKEALLRRQIADLVAAHRSRGWFGQDKWTEEGLWTLYALQEGVSRLNLGTVLLETDRGQGTADLIEFFQKLGKRRDGQSDPRMCIISGSTHVLFDGKHQMRRQEVAPGVYRRVVAFNESNDLKEKPERGHVTHLRRPFPGTLISMRFFFDRKHLQVYGGQDVKRSHS